MVMSQPISILKNYNTLSKQKIGPLIRRDSINSAVLTRSNRKSKTPAARATTESKTRPAERTNGRNGSNSKVRFSQCLTQDLIPRANNHQVNYQASPDEEQKVTKDY